MWKGQPVSRRCDRQEVGDARSEEMVTAQGVEGCIGLDISDGFR